VQKIRTKIVRNVGVYKTTLWYYPVSNTDIYDFSFRIEHISSGDYYKNDVEFQITQLQSGKSISYTPFLYDGHTYKMRQALGKTGQYRIVILFEDGGFQKKVEFPVEIQEWHIEDVCQWCGMTITHSKTVYILTLNTGEEKKACCIHCALNMKSNFKNELKMMDTLDYLTGEHIECKNVWFVRNPELIIKNSMPPYILAFKSKQSAIDFQNKYQGEIIHYNKLKHEILKDNNADFSLENKDDASLLKKLIQTIQENYYKEIDIEALENLSIEEVMSYMDKHSLLKEMKPSPLDFIRGFERDRTISDGRVINDTVGYIKIKYFGRRTEEDFLKAMTKMAKSDLTGLIIDLRDNQGGNLSEAVGVMQYFTSNGILLASFIDRYQKTKYYARTDLKWDYPLVIIINNNTASSAEIFAAVLQHYRKATLVGTNSYGKCTIQKIFPLDHKNTLLLTVGKCYFAGYNTIKNSGLQPDYFIKDNKEQMKFAIEVIKKHRHFQ